MRKKPLPTDYRELIPSTDRTDPDVMKRAQTVAKRRNNAIRRKLPLLADQFPVITADEVMDQRERLQASHKDWRRSKVIREHADIERYRNELEELVSPDEFLRLEMKINERRHYGRSLFNNWHGFLQKIRRRNDPMPLEADLVLAWLQAWEGDPPTIGELHVKCGDGLTKEQIRAGLDWLAHREFVTVCLGRPCTVTKFPFCATWRAL